MCIRDRVKDNEFEEINLFEVNKLIDEINEKIDNIINVREDIIKEKYKLKEVIIARWMEERYEPNKDDIKQLVAFEGAQYIQLSLIHILSMVFSHAGRNPS